MNAQTTHQAANTVQNALQAAMKTASDKAQEKADNVAPISGNNKDLQSVIGRKTVLGNTLLFIVDTHQKLADGSERIKYWEVGSNALKDAPIEFYRQSKPIGMEETQKLTTTYAKVMKIQSLVVRQRLVKDHVATREQDGSISLEAQNEWKATMKAKFKAAFDKAIDEAFANM